MTKKQLIEDILSRNIHHNIRLNFQRLPDNTDEDEKIGFDLFNEAGFMIEFFKANFEDIEMTPENDNGNRNMGRAEKRKGNGIDDASIKGEIWQSGRMGATLYWDAYYNESGRIKMEGYELYELDNGELKAIQTDLDFFDNRVAELMTGFYDHLADRLEDLRASHKAEIKAEKAKAKAEKEFAFNFFAHTAKPINKIYGKHIGYAVKDNVISFASKEAGEFSITIAKID